MKNRTRVFVVAVFCLAASAGQPNAEVADEGMVIENVTVISPERQAPLSHAFVVIRNGRIVDIGTGVPVSARAKRIDGTGRFLIPGLIDSHVHVGHSAAMDDDAIDAHPDLWASYRAQVPRAFLAFGFTSVVDLDLAPKDRVWFEGTPLHPRFYSCGPGIKVAGGYMAFRVPAPSAENFPNLVYEAKEAEHWPKTLNPADYSPERAMARAADAQAICVKAFVESGFGMFNWPYLCTRRHCKKLPPGRKSATWCSWFTPPALTLGARRSMRTLTSWRTVFGFGRAVPTIRHHLRLRAT